MWTNEEVEKDARWIDEVVVVDVLYQRLCTGVKRGSPTESNGLFNEPLEYARSLEGGYRKECYV